MAQFVWNGALSAAWSTGSNWLVEGVAQVNPPTSADDVAVGTGMGATNNALTLTAATTVRSVDFTGYTGTFTHDAAVTLSIGDATAGAGNVALKLVSGMTYTKGNADTSAIRFLSTSATQQSIDTGGKTLGNVTFDGAGGSWRFAAASTIGAAALLTLTRGSLDTGGVNHTWGRFASSNTNTRALALGASVITLQNSTATATSWDITTSTNMTLNAGTSHIIQRGSASAPTFGGGGLTYYDVSLTQSNGGWTISSSNTFRNLTMDNTVVGTGNRALSFASSTTQTINGTITYKANNATDARGRMFSAVRGSVSTIALGTTGTAALTDIDIEDITFTGTNTPVTAAAGRLGNGGGNTGITFPAPTTYYWIGNGGSMNDVSKYSTTSGGAAGTVIPLIHDTIIFDANSITAAGQVIVNNVFRMGTIDFSAVANNPTYNPRNPSAGANAIYGSLILKSGMTVSAASATSSVIPHEFRGRGNHTITTDGVSFGLGNHIIIAPGGTYTLGSSWELESTRTLSLSFGTFNANGYNVTCGLFSSSNTNIRTITMGSGTWTLTGTGTIWNLGTSTNGTLNCNTSTILISDTSAASKTFSAGGANGFNVYHNLEITGGGTGAVVFTANNRSFNNFTVTGPKTVQFAAALVTTINGIFNAAGTAGNLITLNSSTPGSQFTLSKASGRVSSDYLALQDSNATGGATWYAGANSTNVSGNSGWIFAVPSDLAGRLLTLGVG